ncbi:MAG: ribbon-helix-helix domain-containing protein [Candidatus Baldrarchaeia archaeon]
MEKIKKIPRYFLNTEVFPLEGLTLSVVWTIKVSKDLDRLVSELVKELGYTGKAEFIREAVRDAILRKNIGLLGLYTMDVLSNERGDPFDALKRLLELKVPKEVVEKALREGREELEKLLKGENVSTRR